MKKKHKGLKITLIVVTVILLIVTIGFVLLMNASSMGLGNAQVADFEKKVEIWGDTTAGNSEMSKLDNMEIDYGGNLLLSTLDFASKIVGSTYIDAQKCIDTFTYLYEIKRGFESEKYDDQPYIIPYLVEDSDKAIIVMSGGGFGYKSMDGTTSEGKDIALTLNKNGINAFVLHYRSNPYEYPIPMLDVQRAVRFLKAHALEYKISPEKIGLIGFSAGGAEIGYFINKIQGKNLFPSDYVPDELDEIDDSIACAGMIYPALTFNYNVPMLFSLFDADSVRDDLKREELLRQMDLTKCFDSAEIPQFIAYGTKDKMVNPKGTKDYINVAKKKGSDIEVVVAKGQPHGMDQKYYIAQFIEWFDRLIVLR